MNFSCECDARIMTVRSEVAGTMSCHYPGLSRRNACQAKHVSRKLISDSFSVKCRILITVRGH
jgi:hypothetical protein